MKTTVTKGKNRKPVVVVHTSDWHIGYGNYKTFHDIIFNEKDGFIVKLEEIISLCHEDDIEFGGLIFEGDLYHHAVSNNSNEQRMVMDILNVLINIIIIREKAKIIFIRGTFGHDLKQIENLKSFELNYPEQFEIFDTVGTTTIGDGYSVLCIPEEYMPAEKQDDFYSEFINDKAFYDMIVMHGFFDFNCFSRNQVEKHFDGMPIFDHKRMLKIARLIISGHDHRHQVVEERLAYNGSLNRMSFGEDDIKGFIYTYLDDEAEEIYFMENEIASTFKTFYLQDLIKDENYDFDNVTKIIDSEYSKVDNLRIKVTSKVMSSHPELLPLLRNKYVREGNKLKIEGQSIVLKTGDTITKEDMLGITVDEDSETISESNDSRFNFILDDRLDVTDKIIKFANLRFPESNKKLTKEFVNSIIGGKK